MFFLTYFVSLGSLIKVFKRQYDVHAYFCLMLWRIAGDRERKVFHCCTLMTSKTAMRAFAIIVTLMRIQRIPGAVLRKKKNELVGLREQTDSTARPEAAAIGFTTKVNRLSGASVFKNWTCAVIEARTALFSSKVVFAKRTGRQWKSDVQKHADSATVRKQIKALPYSNVATNSFW